MSLLHLDSESIQDYFILKLKERAPTHADKIINQIKRERGGEMRHRTYAERGVGKTEAWEMTTKLFDLHYRQVGFLTAR